MAETITVETVVDAPMETVWACWTEPEHVTEWNFASDDWECPDAENDLRVDGRFRFTMAAKDGSASFEFSGVYTDIEEHERIAYDLDDGRHVTVAFEQTADGIRVVESFEPEDENPEEMPRDGWQAILDNFREYAERTAGGDD